MLNQEQIAPRPEMQVRCVTPADDYIPDFYTVFNCEGNVIEELSDEIDCWTSSRNPILLVSPTGSGKTTLVYQELIPKVISAGKNILLLSNRVAISVQSKAQLLQLTDHPLKDMLNDNGIRKLELISDHIAVLTYHRLGSFVSDPKNKAWLDNCRYMVADEIHMLTSDAYFNNSCDYYLKLLTSKFQNAIRIYMTATCDDILYPLAVAEQKNLRDFEGYVCRMGPREFYYYRFPTKFDHFDVEFFRDIVDLIPEIKANGRNKWLIFIDGKERGKELAETLGKAVADYIDADQKTTQVFNELLRARKFQKQVLICTQVLDCGINIWDPDLKNVVVMSNDKTSVVQSIGRKRCSKNERFRVYIYDTPMRLLGKRHQKTLQLLDLLQRYENGDYDERIQMASEIWDSQDDSLRRFFKLSRNCLYPNRLAFHKLQREKKFYQRICDGETTLQNEVLSWLEKATPETDDDDCMAQLVTFCDQFEGIELTEELVDSFRLLVNQTMKQQGYTEPQPKRIDTLKQAALNNRLEKLQLPYKIRLDAWLIKREENK